LGLALDEPDDSAASWQSNGVTIRMDQELARQLEQYGDVNIDYVDHGEQQRGFLITLSGMQHDGCGEHGCGSGDCH
jgi:hypothetical protein